jgi:hypothetical protein
MISGIDAIEGLNFWKGAEVPQVRLLRIQIWVGELYLHHYQKDCKVKKDFQLSLFLVELEKTFSLLGWSKVWDIHFFYFPKSKTSSGGSWEMKRCEM